VVRQRVAVCNPPHTLASRIGWGNAEMDITRNQYFLAGLVLLLLGFEFRSVESVQLTPQFTGFLAERTGHPAVAANDTIESLVGAKTSLPPKTVVLPEWIGWFFLSVGAVLTLHSLAMPKPG